MKKITVKCPECDLEMAQMYCKQGHSLCCTNCNFGYFNVFVEGMLR